MQRWLWDGFFGISIPKSQIPGIWNLFSPKKSWRQNPKSPGMGFFFQAKSQKNPKIYNKNKKAELMIVVFLRRKTKHPFSRKSQKNSKNQEKNPWNLNENRKKSKRKFTNKKTYFGPKILAKIDELEALFCPINPSKNWRFSRSHEVT